MIATESVGVGGSRVGGLEFASEGGRVSYLPSLY